MLINTNTGRLTSAQPPDAAPAQPGGGVAPGSLAPERSGTDAVAWMSMVNGEVVDTRDALTTAIELLGSQRRLIQQIQAYHRGLPEDELARLRAFSIDDPEVYGRFVPGVLAVSIHPLVIATFHERTVQAANGLAALVGARPALADAHELLASGASELAQAVAVQGSMPAPVRAAVALVLPRDDVDVLEVMAPILAQYLHPRLAWLRQARLFEAEHSCRVGLHAGATATLVGAESRPVPLVTIDEHPTPRREDDQEIARLAWQAARLRSLTTAAGVVLRLDGEDLDRKLDAAGALLASAGDDELADDDRPRTDHDPQGATDPR